MRRVNPALSNDDILTLFQRADIDGSGTIEFVEFVQMQVRLT